MLGLVSLFCGPGGFDVGFGDAGFATMLAYDNDGAALVTHRHNHPGARALPADLSWLPASQIVDDWSTRWDAPPVGVIGGPPCQSFSVSNVHKDDGDPRHRLPDHYARILAALQAAYGLRFFVFENVPGLVTERHVRTLSEFKARASEAGFNVFEGSLNARDFGVPQDRQRIFVVGVNREAYPDLRFKFPVPTTTVPRTVRDAIGGLPEPVHYRRGLKGGLLHPNHWCLAPKSSKFTDGAMSEGTMVGRCFRVLTWNKPSLTVAYGHREVHVHPAGRRRLSVYEAMLLQGFPPEYVLMGTLSDQIRLVSDAVAPPVARALASEIARQLSLTGPR